MMKNKILLILAFGLALTGCQSIKEGLTGSKGENSDEFLVKKKNPLVLPPKYQELPKPKDETYKKEETSLKQKEFDIQKLLGLEEETTDLPSTQNKDAEEFVLRNIKNN